ncbi:MAG: tetratricopeptide repeat protein, partial [Persicimonas sp.]
MAIKIRKSGGEGDNPESGSPEQKTAAQGSDAFVQASVRGVSWIEENRNLVIGGIVAVFVAVIGIWVGFNYVESQEVEASSTLSPALWAYSVPVEGSPEMEAIRENADIEVPDKVYASSQERWQAVYDEASSALEQTSEGEIAQAARLSKAAAAARLDKPDEAVELYQAYLDGDTDEAVLPFAYLGLANAQAAQGATDEAVATFDKLAEHSEDHAALAMYQKATVLEGAD